MKFKLYGPVALQTEKKNVPSKVSQAGLLKVNVCKVAKLFDKTVKYLQVAAWEQVIF